MEGGEGCGYQEEAGIIVRGGEVGVDWADFKGILD